MSISVKVSALSKARLQRLRRAFGPGAAEQVLRGVRTNDFAGEALDYIQKISAEPSSRRDEIKSFSRERTRARLLSVSEGWRISRTTDGGNVLFNISNLIETTGGKAGRARISSVELGSQAKNYLVRQSFDYFNKEGVPFRVHAGTQWLKGATPPKNYVGRTQQYILRSIVPRLSARILQAYKRKFQ